VAIGSGSLFQIIFYWLKLTKSLPAKIVGFDYAPTMLNGARKKFKKQYQIELHVADATNLPFESSSFDTVNIANSLHCIPNFQKSISEAARILKPNGVLSLNALLVPSGRNKELATRINTWGIKKGILQRPFKEDEVLESIKSVELTILEKFNDGNCLYLRAQKNEAPPKL